MSIDFTSTAAILKDLYIILRGEQVNAGHFRNLPFSRFFTEEIGATDLVVALNLATGMDLNDLVRAIIKANTITPKYFVYDIPRQIKDAASR